jgi:hypothetical protein
MPTKRHDDVEDEILKRLSEGEPLATICASDPKRFPTPMTWGEWVKSDQTLAIAYARAREVGFDAIAARGLEIVDNVNEDPASRRVRADYRLKLLAKWDPKRYGDKIDLTSSDGSQSQPKVIQIVAAKAENDSSDG